MPVNTSTHRSVHLIIRLLVRLSVCLSVRLSARMSVQSATCCEAPPQLETGSATVRLKTLPGGRVFSMMVFLSSSSRIHRKSLISICITMFLEATRQPAKIYCSVYSQISSPIKRFAIVSLTLIVFQ